MEEGAVMMTGLEPDRVLSAMRVLDAQPGGADRILTLVDDYAASNVSEKVVRIILSYTDYISKLVWGKTG
jgi:UDP-N-acetylglucosamine 2-epimerase (non-hydrolysing)